jgi:hypothetical protein
VWQLFLGFLDGTKILCCITIFCITRDLLENNNGHVRAARKKNEMPAKNSELQALAPLLLSFLSAFV